MRRKLVSVVLPVLSVGMILSGCGKSAEADVSVVSDTPNVATSEWEDTPEIVINDGSESEIELDDTTNSVPITEIDLGSYGYQYKYYYDRMIERSDGRNIVFSPEAMHIGYNMYDFFIDDPNKLLVHQNILLDRDCLSYDICDGCTLSSTVWKTSSDSLHVDDSVFYDKYVRVFDNANIDKICNDFISEMTNGLVTKVDPFLHDTDTLKVFEYVDLDTDWIGGVRKQGFKQTFAGADGSVSDEFATISSVSLDDNDYCSYYRNAVAMACKMKYLNGLELVVILPDEGNSVSDLELLDFMNGYQNVNKLENDVYFQMPVFSVSSFADISATDLGLGDIHISEKYGHDENIISALQYANFGVKYVSDVSMDESNVISSYSSRMICDRPFAFYVTDTYNKDILYMGVINKM